MMVSAASGPPAGQASGTARPGWRLTAPVLAGRIDAQEIMQSLRDLGVKISEQQAEKILKRCVLSPSVELRDERSVLVLTLVSFSVSLTLPSELWLLVV